MLRTRVTCILSIDARRTRRCAHRHACRATSAYAMLRAALFATRFSHCPCLDRTHHHYHHCTSPLRVPRGTTAVCAFKIMRGSVVCVGTQNSALRLLRCASIRRRLHHAFFAVRAFRTRTRTRCAHAHRARIMPRTRRAARATHIIAVSARITYWFARVRAAGTSLRAYIFCTRLPHRAHTVAHCLRACRASFHLFLRHAWIMRTRCIERALRRYRCWILTHTRTRAPRARLKRADLRTQHRYRDGQHVCRASLALVFAVLRTRHFLGYLPHAARIAFTVGRVRDTWTLYALRARRTRIGWHILAGLRAVCLHAVAGRARALRPHARTRRRAHGRAAPHSHTACPFTATAHHARCTAAHRLDTFCFYARASICRLVADRARIPPASTHATRFTPHTINQDRIAAHHTGFAHACAGAYRAFASSRRIGSTHRLRGSGISLRHAHFALLHARLRVKYHFTARTRKGCMDTLLRTALLPVVRFICAMPHRCGFASLDEGYLHVYLAHNRIKTSRFTRAASGYSILRVRARAFAFAAAASTSFGCGLRNAAFCRAARAGSTRRARARTVYRTFAHAFLPLCTPRSCGTFTVCHA